MPNSGLQDELVGVIVGSMSIEFRVMRDIDPAAEQLKAVFPGGAGTSWYRDAVLAQDDAFAILQQANNCKHGTFLVSPLEPSPNPQRKEGTFALAVNFTPKNGAAPKLTHHKITHNKAGIYGVNGLKYGDCDSLDSLIVALAADPPPKGWPVRLTTPAVGE